MGLVLGDVSFADFELPAAIAFGGRQGLVVHRLPGGTRVIDVTGRDDAAIRWSGVLTGADAADRARLLDAMRAGGAVYGLRWDAFTYAVVIAELTLTYRNPWWIPYGIKCCVLQDEAEAPAAAAASLLSSVEGDLLLAGELLPLAALSPVLEAPGGMQAGTLANAAALAAVAATANAVAGTLAAGEAGVQSGDVLMSAASAGQLATAAAAQGFVQRARANLVNAGR
jgi:hypothetical protein